MGQKKKVFRMAQTAQTARGKKKAGGKLPAPPATAETAVPPCYYRDRFTPEGRVAELWGGANVPLPPGTAPRGELTAGRELTAAFTELIREAKICAYALYRGILRAKEGRKLRTPGTWQEFTAEHDALLDTFTRDGGRDKYGDTYRRATQFWQVIIPRPMTDEEGAAILKLDERHIGTQFEIPRTAKDLLGATTSIFRIEVLDDTAGGEPLQRFRVECCGMPDLPDADLLRFYAVHPLPRWYRFGVTHYAVPFDQRPHPMPVGADMRNAAHELPTDELFSRWTEEYLSEVQMCVDRFAADEQLGHELARLVAEVRSFEVGQHEGRAFIEKMERNIAAAEALAVLKDGKARLLAKLGELCDHYAPAEVTAPTAGRITWLGSKAELAILFRDLVENKWIRLDGSWPKFANMVQAMFHDTDGKPLDGKTMRQYIKPSGNIPKNVLDTFGIPERPERVETRVGKRLRKNT